MFLQDFFKMTVTETAEMDFNAYVGAETGILKGLSINPKNNIAKNFHNLKAGLSKDEEITCMSWGSSKSEILLGLRNRSVKVFDAIEKTFVDRLDCSEGDDNAGCLRGVAKVGDAVVTASESGLVRVWKTASDEQIQFNTIDVEIRHSGKFKKGSFASQEEENQHLTNLKSGRSLTVMKSSNLGSSIIATGGKENDVQVWDLERPSEPIFRAKNVRHDFLELRVPVWVTDLCFPDSQSPSLLSSVNRYGHVRLYDIRVETERRRPIMELTFPEETLTAMSPVVNKDQVLVGTATGQLGLFDFRQTHKGLFRKFKGCVGSIRGLDCNVNNGYFASVGLDRFVRVYNVNSKKIVQKMYLKSRLNTILLSDNFDPTVSETERVDRTKKEVEVIEEEIKEDEDDEIWSKMAKVGEASTAKKRKSVDPLAKPVIGQNIKTKKKKKSKH